MSVSPSRTIRAIAAERTRLDHRLPVRFEPREALHIALHGRALAAREIVRVAAQAGDGALAASRRAPGIRSNRSIDLLQFVDAAAEALAVLLREFRALRGDEAAEQAATDGADADRYADIAISSSAKSVPRRPARSHRTGSGDLAGPGLHARLHHEDHGLDAGAGRIGAGDLVDGKAVSSRAAAPRAPSPSCARSHRVGLRQAERVPDESAERATSASGRKRQDAGLAVLAAEGEALAALVPGRAP